MNRIQIENVQKELFSLIVAPGSDEKMNVARRAAIQMLNIVDTDELHALMTLARSTNGAIDKSYIEDMLNALLRNDIASDRAHVERHFDNDSGRPL